MLYIQTIAEFLIDNISRNIYIFFFFLGGGKLRIVHYLKRNIINHLIQPLFRNAIPKKKILF